MSIMVLSSKRITALTEGICTNEQMWQAGRYLKHNNYGRLDQAEVFNLLYEIYKLNHECFEKRYTEIPAPFPTKEWLKDNSNKIIFDVYQCLKTIKCLEYNIEEEYAKDINIAKKNLIILKAIHGDLINIILSKIKKYDDADWG